LILNSIFTLHCFSFGFAQQKDFSDIEPRFKVNLVEVTDFQITSATKKSPQKFKSPDASTHQGFSSSITANPERRAINTNNIAKLS
jgi:hypothetical protein